jgi:hypothetical protein
MLSASVRFGADSPQQQPTGPSRSRMGRWIWSFSLLLLAPVG